MVSPALAQTVTAVSGTVLDANGIPYAGGTIIPQFINVSGGASPTVTANGSPMLPPVTPMKLSSSGTFNIGVLANGSITPGSTQWKFLICSDAGSVPPSIGTGQQCFTTAGITIAGATQSITTQINTATPPALTVQATLPNVGATGVLKFGASTGLSLLSTGVLAVGNGTAGDTTGSIDATLQDVESTCPAALVGTDFFCADSTLHAWTQSLNGAAYLPTPELAGDLGGTAALPQVTATHLAAALPTAQGGTAQVSTATFPTSGTVNTGTGTDNVIPKFTTGATGILGNSALTDDGTKIISSETSGGYTEGACAGNASGKGILCANSTVHSVDISTNNSGFTGVPQVICANVTPVTVNTSTTADQNLQACTIPAGTLNRVGRILTVSTAGIYSTAANSTAQVTYKAKLCTVSGCGSGTVVAVCSIQSVALATITVTNNTWIGDCLGITQTAGASAVFERSGHYFIDLGSLTTAADSVFLDPAATAVTSAIDSTAQLFLQISGAFSAASGSNTMSGRSLVVTASN